MAKLAGYGGNVDWAAIFTSDGGYCALSWSLDITADMLDVTCFESTGDRGFIRGLKQWTGSIELKVDSANQIVPSDVGASAVIKLFLDDTSYLTGTALCSGWHPSVSVDSEETQTLDIQGTGALTKV